MPLIERNNQLLTKTVLTPEQYGVLTTANATYNTSDYSDLVTLAAVVGTNDCTIVVDSAVTISANYTIGGTGHAFENAQIIVTKTGSFVVASGKTLTINAPFQCGLFQCFSGTGAVVFGSGAIRYYEPTWFGSTTQPPVTNGFAAGTITKNITPAVGQAKGWVCTVAGSPGTWVSEGNL